jgi:ankyrin repeat protein
MLTGVAAVVALAGCRQLPVHATIREAAEENDWRDVQRHLRRGAAVNTKDDNGLTLLHVAAQEGSKRMTQDLLDAGADVHAQDNDGLTPLHWAAYKGRVKVAELLLLSFG